MFTIREYVKVSSLEEAYELNQKKANVVFGGGVWLRLGRKNIQTAIDLSGLGLDEITEDENEFPSDVWFPCVSWKPTKALTLTQKVR